jgi:hypothetical protein
MLVIRFVGGPLRDAQLLGRWALYALSAQVCCLCGFDSSVGPMAFLVGY